MQVSVPSLLLPLTSPPTATTAASAPATAAASEHHWYYRLFLHSLVVPTPHRPRERRERERKRERESERERRGEDKQLDLPAARYPHSHPHPHPPSHQQLLLKSISCSPDTTEGTGHQLPHLPACLPARPPASARGHVDGGPSDLVDQQPVITPTTASFTPLHLTRR